MRLKITSLILTLSPGTVRTASVWQVRRPLYTGSSGRWRHYEEQLAPILPALVR